MTIQGSLAPGATGGGTPHPSVALADEKDFEKARQLSAELTKRGMTLTQYQLLCEQGKKPF